MIRRFFKSRGVRKFKRDRMAVLGMGVILCYFLMAVLVAVGMITRDDARARVLPDRFPGFLETPKIEKRLQIGGWYLERFEFKLEHARKRKLDPREQIEALALAERVVADIAIEEIVDLIEEGWESFDEAEEMLDERDDLLDEIDELLLGDGGGEGDVGAGGDEGGGGELEEARSSLAQVSEEIDVLIAELEAVVLKIQPMPTGWDGFKYKTRTFLGSDSGGASISANGFYSIKIAFQVGFGVAMISVLLGALLGSSAAFFGGWVDVAVMWLVSTLSSIPSLVLIAVLVYMFRGSMFDDPREPFLSLVPLYAAMCMTFWVGTCRVVRGEVLKIKELEYVQAATAIGFGRFYILVKHVIPNTAYLMFINFSLLFIGAVKSEVILTFLGLGVKGQPSWGRMIAKGQQEVTNFAFWEIGTATVLMFGLVLSFNIVSDALQDAFDPKHVG